MREEAFRAQHMSSIRTHLRAHIYTQNTHMHRHTHIHRKTYTQRHAHTCANRHTHINRDTRAHTYPSGPEWVRGPQCVGEDSSSPRRPQRPGQPRLPTPLRCDCPGHRGAGQCHIHQSRGEAAAEDREAPEGGTCPGPLTQAREAAAGAGLPALASIWPQRHPDQPGGDWELGTRRSLLPQLCLTPTPAQLPRWGRSP